MTTWYDELNGLNVVFLALPDGIDEAVTVNPDGSYTAFISTQICEDRQRKAYQHALWHISHDDFWKPDVQNVEYEAHRHTDH